MKIRNGFITNSSSSSFILIQVDNKELTKILMELSDALDTMGISEMASIQFSGNNKFTYFEEGCLPFEIDNVEDFIHAFASLISPNIDAETLTDIKNTEGLFVEDKAAIKIIQREKEIKSSMEVLDIDYQSFGYGGDDESRYDMSNYTTEQLHSVYCNIAKQLNKNIDDITYDDFSDYVSDMCSCETIHYRYNKSSGKIKIVRIFELD